MVYRDSVEGLTPEQLQGFFVGWPNPPSPEVHLRLLRQSAVVILAQDTETQAIVGFMTAITDGVLAAYIPFLEVLPSYQHRGIGRVLVSRMLERLKQFYMIDLLCDEELQPFYESLGMHRAVGMLWRNYEHQAG
ncbi:MAG: GNAT family N-acetyltransferase [Chloroflexi bacterium]|nr:GNAT family N-acetyltransferase [Chloroflexota bacterium]